MVYPLPKSHQCYLYTLDYKVSSLIERRTDFTVYTCFHIFYTRVFNKDSTEFTIMFALFIYFIPNISVTPQK